MGIITSRWEAGPLEAVLTPSFGDVVDVLVGPGTQLGDRWRGEQVGGQFSLRASG